MKKLTKKLTAIVGAATLAVGLMALPALAGTTQGQDNGWFGQMQNYMQQTFTGSSSVPGSPNVPTSSSGSVNSPYRYGMMGAYNGSTSYGGYGMMGGYNDSSNYGGYGMMGSYNGSNSYGGRGMMGAW
ncbi:hypothetical protein [Desulfosporosinus sp. FKA]|uniref:hypothetical protein n=1 Tax=Desulfosporosinus sp. FKA TaxID=1969834 RepID=UPI000B4970ED|nr:hypothetical protein [Desulfosporosinus sp. FKA]